VTNKEMETKITQAIGGALTCMTVMWTAYIEHRRFPTHDEIDAVVVAAAGQAWKGIVPILDELEAENKTLKDTIMELSVTRSKEVVT